MIQTKQIHELLYMSAELYEEHYTEIYLRWCIGQSKNSETDLQKIVANSCISKWYNYEFNKLEQNFKSLVEPKFGKLRYIQSREIYNSIITEMFLKFPQPLLEQARHLNINSN